MAHSVGREGERETEGDRERERGGERERGRVSKLLTHMEAMSKCEAICFSNSTCIR